MTSRARLRVVAAFVATLCLAALLAVGGPAHAVIGGVVGSGFIAGGDLSGSSVSQTVVGFQSRPVSAAAPGNGQAYLWNGASWAPGAVGGVGVSWNYTATVVVGASPYTASASEWVWVDASGGNVTVNGPAGQTCFVVTKADSSANTVTIVPNAGTIGGAGSANAVLSLQDQGRTFCYDGTRTRLGL